MKHEADIPSASEGEPEGQALRSVHMLTSSELGYSFRAAAVKCEEVSSQLVHLAELLRCTRTDTTGRQCVLDEQAVILCMIRGRRLREKFFDARLFADPAWDILLELYLAHIEQRRVTISSLAIAAAVPASTAMRYISLLVDQAIIARRPNPFDGRVVYAELGDTAVAQMRSFFVRFSEMLHAASTGNPDRCDQA